MTLFKKIPWHMEKEAPPAPSPVPEALETGVTTDSGVYIGVWEPKDRTGKSLGKTFNIFAAPEDLTDDAGKKVLLTFNEAVQRVASLKNWHGHDGGDFANDTAIYKALADGSYHGAWFIPTKDILHGQDMNGKDTGMQGLYQRRDTGDFKGSLANAVSGSFSAHWYWSCTEPRDDSSKVYAVVFTGGDALWAHKDTLRLSSRVVRAELRP